MTRTLDEEVVDVVLESTNPTTAWDVVYTLGWPKERARQALKRASDLGRIHRLCRGRYISPVSEPPPPKGLLAFRVDAIHAYSKGREVTLRELDELLGDVGYHATRRAILASNLVCVRRLSDAKKVYVLP